MHGQDSKSKRMSSKVENSINSRCGRLCFLHTCMLSLNPASGGVQTPCKRSPMWLLHTLLLLQGGPQPVPPPHPCRPLASACQHKQQGSSSNPLAAVLSRSVARVPALRRKRATVFAGTSSNRECSSAQLMLSWSVGRESVVPTRAQYLLGSPCSAMLSLGYAPPAAARQLGGCESVSANVVVAGKANSTFRGMCMCMRAPGLHGSSTWRQRQCTAEGDCLARKQSCVARAPGAGVCMCVTVRSCSLGPTSARICRACIWRCGLRVFVCTAAVFGQWLQWEGGMWMPLSGRGSPKAVITWKSIWSQLCFCLCGLGFGVGKPVFGWSPS